MSDTVRKLLDRAVEALSAAGVPEAANDTWLLWEHVSGWNRAEYFLRREEEPEAAMAERFESLADRRCQRIPLQQILGEAWFMGISFRVSEDVLTPRADTECLVEAVLESEKKRKGEDRGRTLLDLCTGSGCIALSLAELGAFAEVTASDISPKALAVARENAEALGWRRAVPEHAETGCGDLSIGCMAPAIDCGNPSIGDTGREEWGSVRSGERFRKPGAPSLRLVFSDLFGAFAGESFDVITANPPYIPSGDIAGLMPEVRDHEPRLALDGQEDGLAFYRRLAAKCGEHLNPGGTLFFEIGWDQGQAVKRLLESEGFCEVRIQKDLAGNDRVVTARRNAGGTRDV